MSTGALLCKPARDGVSYGDCPFTHYARMAIHLSGKTEYDLKPTAKPAKPAWLMDEHGGSLPCWAPNGFDDGSGAVADSGSIAALFCPPTAADEAAMGACGGLFGGIATFLKDTGDDAAVATNLNTQLAALEGALGDAYLSGAKPGLADAFVATKLFVLFVAGGEFKGFALDAKYPKIARYWALVSAHPAFYATRYPEAEMVFGWGQARGGGH